MLILKSFSSKLIIRIATIVSTLFIFTLLCVSVTLRGFIANEATKSANTILKASISDIENEIEDIENITANYAYLAIAHIDDTTFLKEITEKMVSSNPYIFGCTFALAVHNEQGCGKYAPYSYLSPEGKIIQLYLENNYDYWKSDWYTIPYNTGKAVWSEPYFDDGGGECWLSTYSYPIKNRKGEVLAIITADIPLEWIKNKNDMIHPYKHSFATIISKEGHFLSSNDNTKDGSNTIIELSEKTGNDKLIELANGMMAGKTGNIIYSKNGKRFFTVYGPLKNGWSMSITSEYTDILHNLNRLNIIILLIGIFGLLLMAIICNKSIRRITQPLTEFSVSAMNMAKGNFKAQLPNIKSEDEMKRLHTSLSYMQQTISTYITELKTTTKNNERMESELNIARNIQLAMLPKDFPKNELCKVHALMVPAKEVGGDLYDFIIDKDYLYFSIGDVSGKGVPASLLMAIILSVQRFLYKFDFPMNKRIELINQSMSHNNNTAMFCTFFSARINLKTRKMEYCNAGHNAIIVIPADPQEKPYFHNANANLALGLFGDFEYVDQTMDLAPGTRLVLYTDGVDEAETIRKEQFGDERLLETVSSDEFRQLDTEGMVNAIYTTVKNFTSNIEANDDITLLVVEI